MMQVWATKQTWEEHSETALPVDLKIHRIIQTIGPLSISACGIVAPADIYYGWCNFRQYRDITKEPNVCGKCLAESELKIDKE